LNGNDVDEERCCKEIGLDIEIQEKLQDDVQVIRNGNISEVTETDQKIVEDVEISDEVKCIGNEDIDVSEIDHGKSLVTTVDNTVKDNIHEDDLDLIEHNKVIASVRLISNDDSGEVRLKPRNY